MKKVIISKLWKYNTYYEAKNVHLQNKWSKRVYMNQKWGSVKEAFKDYKAHFALGPGIKVWSFWIHQKRDQYHGIMCNETLIEVSESKKSLNIMNKTYSNAIHNGLDLTEIHLNAISKNNILEEFHFILMEYTVFQLCIKSNH